MKWFVLALCLACAALSVDARKRCKSADDCEEGECCVTYAIVSLFGGVCRRLREEGESCTPIVKKDQEEEPDMHFAQCPCVEGLECVATNELTIFGRVIKHKPECVKPDLSTAQPPEPETKEPEPEPETKEPEPEPETKEPEPEPETAEPDPEPEPEEGPGGERPRDDDCEDWTYGC